MSGLRDFLEQARRDWDDRASRNAMGYSDGWSQAGEVDHESRAEETYAALRGMIPDDFGRARRILDLGCGTGRLMRRMIPHAERLVGVDISREMLRLSRDVLKDAPQTGVLRGGGMDLGFLRDGAFDLVYAFAVFIHIPRELFRVYLDEVHRVLRPGGVLMFHLALPTSLRRKMQAWLKLEPKDRATWHRRFYTRGNLEELAASARFEPVKWVEEGPVLWTAWRRPA